MLHETRSKPEDWGLTPTQYASREKARLRERNKKRRQRAVAAAKALVVVDEPQEWPVATFMTPSGFMAYQVERIVQENGNGHMRQVITLPFFSIQM